jgi:hypothetical protein
MAIAQQLVSNSATTIYTSSGSSATTVIFFMNNDASARTLDVYVVPNGGSAGTSTQIIKNLSIDAADTYILNIEKIVLSNGDTIQATASAINSIYATVSYVGI